MSPQPSWSVARTALERVAQDLRDQGYEVFVDPAVSELPDFIREYRPDILARGKQESLIVEVKQPLSETERERIRSIARRVQGHAGWRFMMVAPEQNTSQSEKAMSKPLEQSQVHNWLTEARTLVGSGHSRSGLLAAWAGLEAAMRIAARIHDLSEEADSWRLMRELVSNGILDRESYQQLTDLFRLRSALAHGLEPQSVPEGFDLDAAIEFIARLGERLMSEPATASNPPAE